MGMMRSNRTDQNTNKTYKIHPKCIHNTTLVSARIGFVGSARPPGIGSLIVALVSGVLAWVAIVVALFAALVSLVAIIVALGRHIIT